MPRKSCQLAIPAPVVGLGQSRPAWGKTQHREAGGLWQERETLPVVLLRGRQTLPSVSRRFCERRALVRDMQLTLS